MSPSETLDVLLGRIGTEVADAADHVGSIQIGARGREGAYRLCHADLVDLQKLDLVEQTLRSLVTVLDAIAAAEVGSASIDLRASIDRLPLAGLSDRLRGTAQGHDPSNGHLELF